MEHVLTTVIFGYAVTLTKEQTQMLAKSEFTLLPHGQDIYLFGVSLLNKKNVQDIGSIDLTQIDFATNESDIQEQLNKVNFNIDERAQILVATQIM